MKACTDCNTKFLPMVKKDGTETTKCQKCWQKAEAKTNNERVMRSYGIKR